MSTTIFSVFLLLLAVHTIYGQESSNESDDAIDDSQTDVVQPDALGFSNPFKQVSFHDSSCHCANKQCNCCTGVTIKKHNYDREVCAQLAFVPQEVGVKVALIENGKQIVSKTVSALRPPPICAPIPEFPEIRMCIYFRDISVSGSKLHACASLQVRLTKIRLPKLHFGCVNI